MPDVFLTVEEVGERLKIHPESVRDWLRTGKLKGLKAGRQWRITESALDAFLHSSVKEEDGPACEPPTTTHRGPTRG
jgi:excisionase family DNA binding protein